MVPDIEVVMVKPGTYFVWQGGTEAVVRFSAANKPTVTVQGRDLPHCGKRGATARRRRQYLAAVYKFRREQKVGMLSDHWVVCIHCGGITHPQVGTMLARRAIQWEAGHISAMAIPPEECPMCIEEMARRDALMAFWDSWM